MTTRLTGDFGDAAQITIPPKATETLRMWLLTCPRWSPFQIGGMTRWTQWLLGLARLRDGVPGFPAPHRQFQGATHEVLVMTLDPDRGPYDTTAIPPSSCYLTPQNVVLQFIATDDEMSEVVDIVAQAIVDGRMNPESWNHPGGNEALTADWLTSLTKCLAHVRGEEHAP